MLSPTVGGVTNVHVEKDEMRAEPKSRAKPEDELGESSVKKAR